LQSNVRISGLHFAKLILRSGLRKAQLRQRFKANEKQVPLYKKVNKFDKIPGMLYIRNMVKTKISSKGQTTIPRKFLKLWKTSQVLWDLNPDGTARVAPTPDIMSLLGSAANSTSRDPNEKRKIREAIGRNAAHEGRNR
jgi:hypothetical protein